MGFNVDWTWIGWLGFGLVWMNFGTDHVVSVKTDARGSMIPAAFSAAVQASKERGKVT